MHSNERRDTTVSNAVTGGQDADVIPPSTPIFSFAFLSKSFSISGAIARVWENRLIFSAVVFIFFLLGLYQSHSLGPRYAALLDVQPAQVDMTGGANASAMSGFLGSLTGGDSASATRIPAFIQFQAALSSEGVAKELDRRYDTLCRLFSGQCDLKTHQWKRAGGMRAWFAGVTAWIQGLPDPNGARSPTDLAYYIFGAVETTKQRTGVLTLGYQHSDPKFAAQFIWQLWYVTNNYLKEQDRQLRRDYVSYLTSRINNTASLAQREAIQNLLIEEERRLMQTAADVPYAADILDGPRIIPVNRVMRTMVIFLFMGLVLGTVAALVTPFLRDRLLRRRR